MNRREMLVGTGLAAGAMLKGGATKPTTNPSSELSSSESSIPLVDYEPRSMLRVKETQVERARFPVIDTHTHITYSVHTVDSVELSGERVYRGTPDELLPVMDRKNIRAMVNLTGGYGAGLENCVARLQTAYPGRFYVFTEPMFEHLLDPNYPNLQAQAIEAAHRSGAKGLKVLKTLGLYLRENITTGKLISIDDPRFDPMWDACAQFNMPVAIHIGDPIAFFLPIDRFNERYEELHRHPKWSFYGQDFPPLAKLIEARNRVFARHPRTRFVGLHVGHMAEDLQSVSENLDRFPNMTVDIAARIGELGRQPRNARSFFDKYQDRIVFGTDATPHDSISMQQFFCDRLYEIYFRFLETDDEYFDYAPSPVPPQGRWRISGVNLPESILRKVYYENAGRELGITI